jgi:hypothetical protein
MRTTLDIEDDVLLAAKELAKRDGSTAGQVLSSLARKALASNSTKKAVLRTGVPVLPSRGEIITLESVQQLMDKEGI